MKEIFKRVGPLILVGLLYLLVIHLYTYLLYRTGNLYLTSASAKEVFLGIWGYAWDGMHYLKIATEGYRFPLQAFFPFYPLLINLADLILPQTLAHRLNLMLIFIMLIVLDHLLKINGIKYQRRIFSLIGFLSLPMSFFLIANYNETLYILISGLILILWNKRKFLAGSFLGALLSATKITGIVISSLFFIKFIKSSGETIFLRSRYLFYSGISLLGTVGYFLFLQSTFDDWNIFFKAQNEWKRSPGISVNSFTEFVNKYRYPVESELFRNYLELGILVFLIFGLIYLCKKMPKYIWIYSLLHILIPISTGSLLSLPRLSLLAYPIYIWIFSLVNKKVGIILMIFFGILQFYSIYLFYNNVFVG